MATTLPANTFSALIDLYAASRAEQDGVHGDGEVRQHLDQAGRLETAMKRRALGGDRPVPLPLAHRPEHEALADGQGTGATGTVTTGPRLTWERVKPLF